MWVGTQELDFVQACSAKDFNANTTCFPCAAVNMGRYESMVAIVNMGAGSTFKCYVQAHSTGTTVTPGSTGQLAAFSYRYSGAADNASTRDVLADYTAVASTDGTTGGYVSFDATTSPNCALYIEVKANEMPEGYPYVMITISTAAQAHPGAVNYVLRPRYAQNTMLQAGS